jgi:hypothetical protein
MRALRQTILILLAVLSVAYIGTLIYQGSSTRHEPPVISCPEGVLEVSASDDESVLLAGVTASDKQDGDLTDQIIIGGISKLISKDTAKVTLMVFDSDDNMGKLVRYIRYTDYHRPQFSITKPLSFSSTKEVSLLNRLKADDVVDGDISSRIRISTLASTDNSEIYDITIQVTNSMGDTAWLQLPVLVQETNPLRPVIDLSSYLVYLEVDSSFDAASYLSGLTVAGVTQDHTQVSINNNVDTTAPGTYRVLYTYSAEGVTGTAILTVVVQ